jgi:putative ABC transport system substrate-binding protein
MISGMLAAHAISAFSLFALCSPAIAQQPTGTRTGYLSVLSPSSDHVRNQAFRQGLRELGYIDGQNIRI